MTEPNKKQVILIVDDSREDINILGSLLREEYNLRIAIDGEKALKIVESGNYPDLILLDIMMPGISGYEVCKILKSNTLTQHIPIIFITGKTSEDDEVTGFELGAIDYITKPFRSAVVKARIHTHMELKKYRDYLINTSYCDGLTSISNRRHFDEHYDNMWKIAIREAIPLSLIMIDIDDFKQFNDNYGHSNGDRALRLIAKTLENSIERKTDIIARYGGEEFVCLLASTRISGAINIAEKFNAAIGLLQIPHGFSTTGKYVTISQGIASTVPLQKLGSEELINTADECLYKSKKEGKNRFNFRELD